MIPRAILLDNRNWSDLKDQVLREVSEALYIGFDIETCDPDRHEGLNRFMSESTGKKLVFDTRRTTVTGFSIYCDGLDHGYYVNLNHADVENRIPWSEARQILEGKPPGSLWICHNSPFELTMMRCSLGYELKNVVCTLQMAVSNHNEDQYPWDEMMKAGWGGMQSQLYAIGSAFHSFDQDFMTDDQQAVASRILAKESKASHSYNGYVKELAYGYGLKKLTKSLFDYDQPTFAETLNGKEHMGELTGEEVVQYGFEDAYWAVRIFHELLPRLAAQNDQLIETFFEQENPMTYVFSDVWSRGLRINKAKVEEHLLKERHNYANAVRDIHQKIGEMLPYPSEYNARMTEIEAWYRKNPDSYRNKITKWASTPLPSDDSGVIASTSGPVSKNLLGHKTTGLNLSYYMTVRSLLYDLAGMDPIIQDGKFQSDADARAALKGKGQDELIGLLENLGSIEQRMKLYLNPYLNLIDPETGRVYPQISSQLNSRRMGMSNPNGMQLAKRGESSYIRSFYEADEDDHVVLSMDWSQIELVEIGDFSGDPSFKEAYGQLPYKDLHKKAVADMMDIAIEKVTKDLRTKIGKGANFNYWYSGALNTVGTKMGWDTEKMWEMTRKYRETFEVAEQWRLNLIEEGRDKGYITLPDGHRRVKYEATYQWQMLWRDRWEASNHPGLANFGQYFVRKITNRAANQLVNSMIQGSCATLAKRSILRILEATKHLRRVFMMPIHDELVWSVHRDDVIEFLHIARRIMTDHPDIIKTLVMDCTASIGRNFEPYNPETAPYGQIELDEAPSMPGVLPPEVTDGRLNDDQIRSVIQYLFNERELQIAA